MTREQREQFDPKVKEELMRSLITTASTIGKYAVAPEIETLLNKLMKDLLNYINLIDNQSITFYNDIIAHMNQDTDDKK